MQQMGYLDGVRVVYGLFIIAFYGFINYLIRIQNYYEIIKTMKYERFWFYAAGVSRKLPVIEMC